MRLKEIKKRVLSLLGLTVLNFIVNLVTKTYRIKIFNETAILKVLNNNEQFISAFWHGRMLIPWYVQRKYKIAALVSRSKDGDILTKLLNNWNYNVVRGSSHIGGKEALKIMEDKIDEGFSFAITPDGPTGPQFKMKPGAVVLAHRKSIPLVLIGTASKKHYVFNSWDKFQVPKAFSKVTVIYSDPIYVNEKSTREEISKLIQDCELELNKLQEEAEQIVNTNN
ncbi:MAG: DUF374 domain-containing protein [Ignavibacteriales bacterium]|jgi:lysophospholipid acyltransferase (LPLAT)-like uncharacterized protein|nr:lysophospholipid acyltransferase family protein [Melioribacteraceae bacterium]RJP60773.1 MAG: DUF374 domain-containing protein [Ignavibacteriales bacterium]